jgi:hypothetical protein
MVFAILSATHAKSLEALDDFETACNRMIMPPARSERIAGARGSTVLSHEFALLCFESLAKIESAVAVQTNGLAAEL